MKFVFAALTALLISMQAGAKELFSARCEPALTKGVFSWRVEETKRGLAVRYSDPKKQFGAEIAGADADALRAKIAALRFSQRDIEFLRSREVRIPATKKEEEKIVLRPFDGATYHFSFSAVDGVREVTIDNPTFDFEHHASLEETTRLREAMALLDAISRIAKKEKEANQTSEPTAPSGRGSP
jgi:hypothetical protein